MILFPIAGSAKIKICAEVLAGHGGETTTRLKYRVPDKLNAC
jgi:hypothetical protein